MMLGYGDTIQQRTIVHIHYFRRVFANLLMVRLIAIISMAECESESEITPYRFEPVSVSKCSDDKK